MRRPCNAAPAERRDAVRTHFGPGCQTNGDFIEDFGLRDIPAEGDGPVSVQGINDTAFALAVDDVRKYCLGDDKASKSGEKVNDGSFPAVDVVTEVKPFDCFVEVDDFPGLDDYGGCVLCAPVSAMLFRVDRLSSHYSGCDDASTVTASSSCGGHERCYLRRWLLKRAC